MNLTSLSSADLKQIGKLLVRREALVDQIRKVDQQLTKFETGVLRSPAPKIAVKGRSKKRRDLKSEVVGLLQRAGKDGMTVKALATELNLGPNRIYTWFYGTGKKVKEIRKIGEAKYRWAT